MSDGNGARPDNELSDEEKALELEERRLKLEVLKAKVWKDRIGVLSAVFRILPTPKEAPLLWIALIGTLGGGGVKAGLHFFGMNNPALFNINSVSRAEAPAPEPAPAPSTETIVASVEATVTANREARRAERRARRTATAEAEEATEFAGEGSGLGLVGTGRGGGGSEEGTIGLGRPDTIGHGAVPISITKPVDVALAEDAAEAPDEEMDSEFAQEQYVVMDQIPEEPEELEQLAIEVNEGKVVLIPHDGHEDEIRVEDQPHRKHLVQEPEGYRLHYTQEQVERWLFGHKLWMIFWFLFIGGAWEIWRIRRRRKAEKAKAAELAEEDEIWHVNQKGD